MGDMAEVFNAMQEASKKKRASNRKASTEMLDERGIPYESKNNGAHLIVAGTTDFWPSTGLWIIRGRRGRHRGVRSLIRYYLRGDLTP